jgi:hypothetical protein
VDIVGNCKPVSVGSSAVNTSLEVVLGSLDLLRSELVVVVGVQIEGGDDVAECLQVSLASCCVASRVRGTHIGGVFADDVADGHLVLDHLIETLLLGDFIEVLVRPSMAGNLMALGVHVLDNTPPVLINGAFAKVVASNEEGCVGVARLELCHNLLSVDIWAIIVGDGDGLRLQALPNTNATILNCAQLSTSIIASGGSIRGLVSIATWTKVDLAIGCSTVLLGVTAVTLR